MALTARKQQEISEKIKIIPMLMDGAAKQDERMRRVEKTMFGNGDPGWDERIRKIEKDIDMQIEKEKKRAMFWDKFQWVIIPFVISGVFVFIGQALVFYFRVLPLIEHLK